jgi:hypothetical protein
MLSVRQNFLARIQHALKRQNGEYQPQNVLLAIFGSVSKSPTQI